MNDLDPFDLPEWLGEREVSWTPATAVRGSARVRGELSAGEERLACDLLAVDEAYPEPVRPTAYAPGPTRPGRTARSSPRSTRAGSRC